MGLGQWGSLQELVSRWSGRLLYSEHDHLSCCHLPCQTFGLKSACSWVHLRLHSIYNVHCNSYGSAGNVTGITQYLKRKCKALKVANRYQEPKSPTDSLPDRLINAVEYELPFHTPQKRVDPTEEELVNEAQGRLTPVYTCDTTND